MAKPRAGTPPGFGETIAAERAVAGTPLYVHLPFCAAKCHYCDFFSVPADGQDRGALIRAVLREARELAPRHPQTVYLGGGTPSLLSVEELQELLDGLHESTGFRDSATEVTAECNPESLDQVKARALLDLGVNRLSIGFQSLSDDVLKLFGRVHTVAQSFEAYAAARAAGATNVNIDVIFAVPGQRCADWTADLDRVLDLRPDHLSAYNLTFEEETLFRRWLDEGRLPKAPEEVELELFQATRARARQRGYEAYEISNFSKAGRQCRHNVNYWSNGTYLGLGPSAVSKVGWTRSGNIKGVAGYVRRIERGESPRTWAETPAPSERLAETWWLGLRLAGGVDPDEAVARAGSANTVDSARPIADKLAGDGLLEVVGGRYRLSPRGVPLGDYVARQFLVPARL